MLAGSHIVSANYDFKETLIGGKISISAYTWLAHNVSEQADDLAQSTAALAYSTVGMTGEEKEEGPRCCNGATCASLGLPCCDRSGAKPRALLQPMGTLEERLNTSKEDQEDKGEGEHLGMTDFLAMRKEKKSRNQRNAATTERSIC